MSITHVVASDHRNSDHINDLFTHKRIGGKPERGEGCV